MTSNFKRYNYEKYRFDSIVSWIAFMPESN